MRRILPLLLALLALSGCRSALYSDEYSYVNEHLAPYAVRETTEAAVTETETGLSAPAVKTVSNLYQIRDRIVAMVLAGGGGERQLPGAGLYRLPGGRHQGDVRATAQGLSQIQLRHGQL